MIGLACTLTRMMLDLMIGLVVASMALGLWTVLAILLLLPGNRRSTR